MVDHLYIYSNQYPEQWRSNMELIAFFLPLTGVKNLYVSKQLAGCISIALKELTGERVADVLPALERVYLEELQPSGPVQEAVGQFVAARRLLGHTVTVFPWDRTGDHFAFPNRAIRRFRQSGFKSTGGKAPRKQLATIRR
jgi:hypothetical protein